MALTTAQGREGYGYVDTREYEPEAAAKPEMKTSEIYPSGRRDLFRGQIEKIAQLEKKLREGTVTPSDLRHLEYLKDIMCGGPYGC